MSIGLAETVRLDQIRESGPAVSTGCCRGSGRLCSCSTYAENLMLPSLRLGIYLMGPINEATLVGELLSVRGPDLLTTLRTTRTLSCLGAGSGLQLTPPGAPG